MTAVGPDPAAAAAPARARWLQPGVVASLYAAALFVASLLLHPTFAMWCEIDDYAGQARLLLEGGIPRDVFHPLGYAAFVAAAAWPIGDVFVAGKLVSCASAGLLVWAGYRFVRLAYSPAAAAAIAAALAVHPAVLFQAMQAASDAMGAGTVALALLLVARVAHGGGRADAFLLGGAFALAYWTRYPAIALLVAILPALLLPRHLPFRFRLQRGLWFAAGAAIGLAPHCGLTYAQFGKLFHDENWRNLAMRHFASVDGWFDFSYVHRTEFKSWAEVFLHDPARIAGNTLEALREVFVKDLPGFLTGGHPGQAGPVAWGIYLLIPVGTAAAAWLRRPGVVLGVLFALAYLCAATLTFAPDDRISLPCFLPLLAPAAIVLHGAGIVFARQPWLRRAIEWLAVAAFALYVGRLAPERIRHLQSMQLRAEVAAIRRLAERHGPEVRIGSVAGTLRHQVEFHWFPLPRHYVGPFDAPAYVETLRQVAHEFELDHLVLSRASMQDAARLQQVAAVPMPPELVITVADAEVVVLRVARPVLEVLPSRAGAAELRLRIEAPVARSHLLAVGLLAGDPGGAWHVVGPLPHDDGIVEASFPIEQVAAGDWRLRPVVLTPAGLLFGADVRWTRPD